MDIFSHIPANPQTALNGKFVISQIQVFQVIGIILGRERCHDISKVTGYFVQPEVQACPHLLSPFELVESSISKS
jgi:hypothetical protein